MSINEGSPNVDADPNSAQPKSWKHVYFRKFLSLPFDVFYP